MCILKLIFVQNLILTIDLKKMELRSRLRLRLRLKLKLKLRLRLADLTGRTDRLLTDNETETKTKTQDYLSINFCPLLYYCLFIFVYISHSQFIIGWK